MGWLDSLIEQSGVFAPPVPPQLGRLAGMTGVSDLVKGAVSAAYFAGVRDGLVGAAVVFVVLWVLLSQRKG